VERSADLAGMSDVPPTDGDTLRHVEYSAFKPDLNCLFRTRTTPAQPPLETEAVMIKEIIILPFFVFLQFTIMEL